MYGECRHALDVIGALGVDPVERETQHALMLENFEVM
jgi:hypothetical protein